MSEDLQNSISPKELFKQYDWFQRTFPDVVQNSWDEFFEHIFDLKLMGISKNINCLLTTESCFVTKVNIDKEYELFFRLTDGALDTILTASLGKGKGRFKINSVTELEAKVITTFNSFIFGKLKNLINTPNPSELRRTNFDVIHLTFLLKNVDPESTKMGKFIVSLPLALISPEEITSKEDKFTSDDFPDSEIDVSVYVGKTKFKLYELKHLEEEDIVVFEDSDINHLKIITKFNDVMDCNITPNMEILMPDSDDDGDIGGDEMENAHSLWDSIEVEMNAEFDAVKISLGELKSIENGLVVDLASLYDNTVTLKIEGKSIAKGNLVIVNDRYGVKITEIIAQKGQGAIPNTDGENYEYSEGSSESGYSEQAPGGGEGGDSEEDFDYSDFDLEDEGI